MRLRLLEIIAPIRGIKPRIEEEPRPLRVANQPAVGSQAVLVLRHHEVHVLGLEVAEGVDDAVGRHDGLVHDHLLLELRGRHDVSLDRQGRVHDERVDVDVPEPGGVGELGQGVAHRDNLCPGHRRLLEVVFAYFGEECCVAWARSVSQACSVDHGLLCVRDTRPRPPSSLNIPCFSAYSLLFSFTNSVYLAPNLPSSTTVTITAAGLPEGTWFAIPVLPPLVLCCELPPRVRSHIRPMSTSAAMAKTCDRYRRGIENPTPYREGLLPRGRKGWALEDFLLGYGRCIIYYLCLIRIIWQVVRGLWWESARSPSVKATTRERSQPTP